MSGGLLVTVSHSCKSRHLQPRKKFFLDLKLDWMNDVWAAAVYSFKMVYCTFLSCTYVGGGLIEVFNHKVTGLFSFVTELKKRAAFWWGQMKAHRSPFSQRGQVPYPDFLRLRSVWSNSCGRLKCYWNLKTWLFLSSFLPFFFKKKTKRLAPLWEAVCQRTSVIMPLLPPAELTLHCCISQLLCGFREAVCEVSTSL